MTVITWPLPWVGMLLSLLQTAAASAQSPPPAAPVFQKGEKVEVWWAGKYLPGEVIAVRDKGMLDISLVVNGKEQTLVQPGDGKWVRKLGVAPSAEKAKGTKDAAAASRRAALQRAIARTRAGAAPVTDPFGADPSDPPRTSASSPATPRMRLWTDSTGKHRIVATFAGLEAENLLLTKPDGKTIKLPLAKLSEADRKYAEQLARLPVSAASP